MATKVRDAVQYAVSCIKNPKTGKMNVSANVVERGEKTLDAVAHELARSTTLTAVDVKGVIEGFIEFSMEHLVSGYRIDLGNLGKLYPTISVKPVRKMDDFTVGKIKGLRARFLPSQQLGNLLEGATFEKTLSRKNQLKTMADVDAEIAAKLQADGGDDEEE